jgi:hypothetical protein
MFSTLTFNIPHKMKKNILHSAVLFGALALASCSTPGQLASSKNNNDDVYFSKAEAGDAPVYRTAIRDEDRYVNTNSDDDDYYYYDSYSSRINRFAYNTPFDYYDDYYYGYNTPYGYGGYAYSPWGYGGGLGWGGYGGGWGLGLGFGYGGWGYSPWGYGGFGYSPWGYGGYYSPYSYWGTGYGYGYGGGYWGGVSANNVVRARPYRGNGFPNSTMGGRNSTARPTGYSGNYPNTMSYPGRRPQIGSPGSGSSYTGGRPGRGDGGNSQPVYRPTRTEASRPQPQPTFDRGSTQSSGGGMSGGGGGGSRGGGRPSRP